MIKNAVIAVILLLFIVIAVRTIYSFYQGQPSIRAEYLLEKIKKEKLCLDGKYEVIDAGYNVTDDKYKVGLLLAYRKENIRYEEYWTDERIKLSLSKCIE